MKNPRDRAVEVAHKLIAPSFTRGLFERLLDDNSEAGKNARETVRTLTQAFEEDRREVAAAARPS
jgi:phage tail tape-measure protein